MASREQPTEDFVDTISRNLELGEEADDDNLGTTDDADISEPTDDLVYDTQDSDEPQDDESQDDQSQGDDPLAGLFETTPGETVDRPEKYTVNKAGDLVNAKGEILAKSGTERRLYQNMHKAQDQAALARQENASLRTKVIQAVNIGRELQQRLKLVQEQSGAGAKLGLSEQEVTAALQTAAELKQNPAQGLKKLLTQLSVNGINIESLGLENPTIDPSTFGSIIRQEIDGATKSLREGQERQRQAEELRSQQTQQYQRVEQATRQFFQQNPDAIPYLPALQRMYGDPRYANNSLRENWLQLQLHLAKNASADNFPRTQRSLPNGRPGSAAQQEQANTTRVAPVDAEYKDIVSDILREFNVT